MKDLLKNEGLARAGKWYIWSKVVGNFVSALLIFLVLGFFAGSMLWMFKQISMMGW